MDEPIGRILRQRRSGQRRVRAMTLVCGTGATALSAAFAALLATEQPAGMNQMSMPSGTSSSGHSHHGASGSAGTAADAQADSGVAAPGDHQLEPPGAHSEGPAPLADAKGSTDDSGSSATSPHHGH